MAILGPARPALERKGWLREWEQGARAKPGGKRSETLARPIVESVGLRIALPAELTPHFWAAIAGKYERRRWRIRRDLGNAVVNSGMECATHRESGRGDGPRDFHEIH